ncbi:hypothetical protein [Burkholderia multivorans]|uniref:hypothetical protein n=1 Tax=Burkholderia multivorans TaxID=87883 RepID=UPI0015E488E6|nr:hypothetical protein [Burkholderia multivorans]
MLQRVLADRRLRGDCADRVDVVRVAVPDRDVGHDGGASEVSFFRGHAAVRVSRAIEHIRFHANATRLPLVLARHVDAA